jgi:hypothetical protein
MLKHALQVYNDKHHANYDNYSSNRGVMYHYLAIACTQFHLLAWGLWIQGLRYLESKSLWWGGGGTVIYL